jgi:hypothetical protein
LHHAITTAFCPQDFDFEQFDMTEYRRILANGLLQGKMPAHTPSAASTPVLL